MNNRRIMLAGAYNVRDLGGYDAANGKTVRWRSLIRSDGTHALTADDIYTLLDYGLKSVIDLRTQEEANELPSVFESLNQVKYQVASLFPTDSVEAGKGGSMADWYNYCLEHAKIGIRAVLEAIYCELAQGCTLINCGMGKDRTGIVSALVLRMLGVRDEDIVIDYALTWEYLAPVLQQKEREAKERGEDTTNFYLGLSAAPETMIKMLSHINDQYGDIGSYLDSVGMPINIIDSYRQLLLR